MNHRTTLRLAIFQLRPEPARLAPEHRAFCRAMRLDPAQLIPVDVLRTRPSKDLLRDVQGFVIAGSPLSVQDESANVLRMGEIVATAQARRVPMFGVCYGAQFLAHVFGGYVHVESSKASEHGTHKVHVVARDRLFDTLPDQFHAQQAHDDCIAALPQGATLLATSERCSVQAFTFRGTRTYATQFHPERTRDEYEQIVADKLRRGIGCPVKLASIRETLTETPHAASLLERFVDHVVLGS